MHLRQFLAKAYCKAVLKVQNTWKAHNFIAITPIKYYHT